MRQTQKSKPLQRALSDRVDSKYTTISAKGQEDNQKLFYSLGFNNKGPIISLCNNYFPVFLVASWEIKTLERRSPTLPAHDQDATQREGLLGTPSFYSSRRSYTGVPISWKWVNSLFAIETGSRCKARCGRSSELDFGEWRRTFQPPGTGHFPYLNAERTLRM